METPKEYHYVYYSYEEYGRGYIGSRGCKCLPEQDIKYFGSFKDKTFKPTQKIIIKDDYTTREEAYVDEIILQQYYKVAENPHFANRAYQTSAKFYLPKEDLIKLNMRQKELGIGLHGLSPEQRTENAKKGGNKTKELGIGVCGLTKEQRRESGKIIGAINGKKTYENGTGLFSLTKEETREKNIKGGKAGSQKNKENALAIFALTKEQLSNQGKKTTSQKWMCLETGFITSAGNLVQYQRARGIDTSKRKRIS